MNYLAHAYLHLDRPEFLAGLATPDWLSVVDRKARVRRKSLEHHLPDLSGQERELALGIMRHLDDDQWFHGTAAFFELTGEIAGAFRKVLDPEESWRCGFLGHVVLELLLDAALIDARPTLLTDYYQAMEQVDPEWVEGHVIRLATRPPASLARFIEIYRQERFLEDYVDDRRLLWRLNQVMQRVGLNQLPAACEGVLAASRFTVRRRMADLLPPE